MMRLLLLVFVFNGSIVVHGADLGKIDRTIKKEPVYKGKPSYALLVFGLEAKKRIWVVRDGDVLYVDRNSNGDLTDAGERIQGTRGVVTRDGAGRQRIAFHVEGITGAKGEKLGFVYDYYEDRTQGDFLFLYEDFRIEPIQLTGKRIQGVTGEFDFSSKREDCPVYHFQGPLTFVRVGQTKFAHGEETENLTVRIGTAGFGKGSFAKIETDSVPGDVDPKAEIIFPGKTPADAPIRRTLILDRRC
jgi:hypothetical protein